MREGASTKDIFANVTRRRDKTFNLDETAEEEENFDMAILMLEIRNLRQAVNDLTNQNAEIALLRKDVLELKSQLSTTLGDSRRAMAESEKLLAARDTEITALKCTISQLEQCVYTHEQELIRNEMEIAGIPEKEGESLYHLTLLTATKIGINLVEQEIDGIYRAGPRLPAPKSPAEKAKPPRPIVVRLVRRDKRDQLVKAGRARSKLTSADIVPGTENMVFLNERLTKINRNLFREARLRAKQHNFRFCWIRRGRIYVRKEEKKPALAIISLEDLDVHIGLPKTELMSSPLPVEDITNSSILQTLKSSQLTSSAHNNVANVKIVNCPVFLTLVLSYIFSSRLSIPIIFISAPPFIVYLTLLIIIIFSKVIICARSHHRIQHVHNESNLLTINSNQRDNYANYTPNHINPLNKWPH